MSVLVKKFTGCGTSFHAAMTGGDAVQALELVLRPEREAELLVIVSHEGETPLTLEAARAWSGPRWLVTGRADLGNAAGDLAFAASSINALTSWGFDANDA